MAVSSSFPFSGSDLFGSALKSVTRPASSPSKKFTIMAMKRVKKTKRQYPWPDDLEPDLNVKGGVLSYLSSFKPLKHKPKPVILDFEKPLVNLEKQIEEIRRTAEKTGLDLTQQIALLEANYNRALRNLYTNLTPIQRVTIARHPNRPTFLDHVLNMTDKWFELHGDRAGYDDPAIVTGLGSMDGRTYMFVGQQKGRNTKENIHRNFGMPTPHGYRKALRFMNYAEHHGFPIITFVDTPGAFADLRSEELGQGEAIAYNLRAMFSLKVPIVSVILGEGGSGGALGISCANKFIMLENAVFYVASPEACAAILWKDRKAAPQAAKLLKITAPELCEMKVADGIIPEPLGGAHADPSWTSQQIKLAVVKAMDELLEMDTQQLLQQRNLKFRYIGGPKRFKVDTKKKKKQEPERKVNMKKKEKQEEQLERTMDFDLKQEFEKLKQKIVKSQKGSPSNPIDLESMLLSVNELADKGKKYYESEFTDAVQSMGLKDKLDMLRNEITKASSGGQLMDASPTDKIKKLKQEFIQTLSEYPNSKSLNSNMIVLKEICKLQEAMTQKLAEVSKVSGMENGLKEKLLKAAKERIGKAGVRKETREVIQNLSPQD